MAKYRYVHTSFWDDSFVLNLSPEDKYFYLYILTNSKSTQCGIYELPKRVMAFETGYNLETIDKLLKRFKDYGKILYSEKTQEICVLNWPKYNYLNSSKIIKKINDELGAVKDKELVRALMNNLPAWLSYDIDAFSIPYIYPIDTVSNKSNNKSNSNNNSKSNKKRELEPSKKDGNATCNVTDDVTRDATVTSRDALDIDIDKDIDKEKDNNISPKGDISQHKKSVDHPCPYQKVVSLYHEICTSLPKVKALTDTRKRYLRARWKEHPDMDFWRELFEKVEASDFLTGRADYGNRKPFIANFEWIIRPNNFAKILEGIYDNRDSDPSFEAELLARANQLKRRREYESNF